jgi:hypothetical protein
MTDLRQAAQAVLNAWNDREGMFEFSLVIEDLDKALEQPEQEPVVDCPRCGHVCSQRPWVGLTPEEILDLFDRNNVYGSKWIEFARTVEAKLKAKNDH